MPHQPRLGVAVSSGALEEITGVGGGKVGAGAGEGGVGAPSITIGAGSRMVERRRGGSCGAAAASAAAGGGSTGATDGGGRGPLRFGRGRFLERRRHGRGILVAQRRKIAADMLHFRRVLGAIAGREGALAALAIAASATPATPPAGAAVTIFVIVAVLGRAGRIRLPRAAAPRRIPRLRPSFAMPDSSGVPAS